MKYISNTFLAAHTSGIAMSEAAKRKYSMVTTKQKPLVQYDDVDCESKVLVLALICNKEESYARMFGMGEGGEVMPFVATPQFVDKLKNLVKGMVPWIFLFHIL